MKFVGGIAGASSEDNMNVADRAFDNKTGTYWLSGQNEPYPHVIWYDFGNVWIRPVNMSFEVRAYHNKFVPTHFQFVGSNEGCGSDSRWTVLCAATDPQVSGNVFEGKCQMAAESFKKYRCVGLKIHKVKTGTGTAAVCRVRVWHVVRMW